MDVRTQTNGRCGSCCGVAATDRAEPSAAGGGLRIRVPGLDCAEEVRLLERAVGPLVGGREHLAFDLLHGRLIIREGAPPVEPQAVLRAIREAGLEAELEDEARAPDAGPRRLETVATVASGLLWLGGMLYHVVDTGPAGLAALLAGHGAEGTPAVEMLLYVAAVLAGFVLLVPRALAALRALRPDMYLLVTIAALGAFGLGAWFEAAAVVFLFSLSLWLERWSVDRARRAVEALLDLAPPRARVVENGTTHMVDATSVQPGTLVRILTGERIPVDGEVMAGRAAVDQAPITGESVPVARAPGDPVYAGTIVAEGTLDVRATRPADDTLLARMRRMIEEARLRRTETERWIDRFARVYTPAVVLAALLLFLVPVSLGGPWEVWLYRALVLLVLACPCALVISTPVSVVSALAAAARRGVLVKGGRHLETAARLAAVAFDKTGTLTLGRPQVRELVALTGDEAELLRVTAALESHSIHPIARALVAEARGRGLEPPVAEEVRHRPGQGLEGTVDGVAAWVGSPSFAEERAELPPAAMEALRRLEDEGRTVVVVGRGAEVLGVIGLLDTPRPEARAAIEALHRLGVRRLIMLTGDHPRTARVIARELGIEEVRAGLLPDRKVEAVRDLAREHPPVAMVGDGVNDAPAMAAAQLGVAMGAIGSDVAIETADVALVTDRLDRVPWLVRHARRMLATIRTNVVFAIAVKLLVVLLTLLGFGTLWMAVAADVGATAVVVAWAMRLLVVERDEMPVAERRCDDVSQLSVPAHG